MAKAPTGPSFLLAPPVSPQYNSHRTNYRTDRIPLESGHGNHGENRMGPSHLRRRLAQRLYGFPVLQGPVLRLLPQRPFPRESRGESRGHRQRRPDRLATDGRAGQYHGRRPGSPYGRDRRPAVCLRRKCHPAGSRSNRQRRGPCYSDPMRRQRGREDLVRSGTGIPGRVLVVGRRPGR